VARTTTELIRPQSETDSFRAQVAKNLWLSRYAAGITQDALAESSGISRATIAQIESGATDCRLATLTDISHALGVSPIVMMLREQEIGCLRELISPAQVERILSRLSPDDLAMMEALRVSGLQKNITRAAQIGINAARAAGYVSRGAAVGAAIGSILSPGLGTAICGLVGTLLEFRPGESAATVADGEGI
jgi:transcriptional regulator with XRE-family HTH domain